MSLSLVPTGTVDVDGVVVPYYDAGPRDSDRLPLILVHGTAGSADSHFGYLLPMLAYRQRVIALDLSAAPDPATALTVQALVRQVMAVADHLLGPQQALGLLGYSLGAVVAAAAAGLHPARVQQLVLVAGWMKTDSQQQLRNHVWRGLRGALSEPTLLREFMAFCAFSPAFMQSRSLADLQAAAAGIPLSPWVDQQMALNSGIDISDWVAQIRATTLVIACSEDQMVPRHHSQQLFGAIEDARYMEIPSGHGVVFERPAELFHCVDQFTRAPQAYPAGSRIPAQRP